MAGSPVARLISTGLLHKLRSVEEPPDRVQFHLQEEHQLPTAKAGLGKRMSWIFPPSTNVRHPRSYRPVWTVLCTADIIFKAI